MAAVCEICGGTKLVKEAGGDYVCRDCGAAYSVAAMRIMLTGEIVDDSSFEGTKEYTSVAPELESSVMSSFHAGDLKKAASQFESYVSEQQSKGNKGCESTVPYANFYGNLARTLINVDNGSPSYLSLHNLIAEFADEIVVLGLDGSSVVKAICECYVALSEECIDRANTKIASMQREYDRSPYGGIGFSNSFHDAMAMANGMLEARRVASEEAIMGIAYANLFGLTFDDDSWSSIAELCSSADEETASIPHFLGAVQYLLKTLDGEADESIPALADIMSDENELIKTGKTLWDDGNFGLAYKAFEAACVVNKDQIEAQFYCSLFRVLNRLTHSRVIDDYYIDSLKDSVKFFFSIFSSKQSHEQFVELLAAGNRCIVSVMAYVDYLHTLTKIQMSNDDPDADSTHECAGKLLESISVIARVIYDNVKAMTDSGINPTFEEKKTLRVIEQMAFDL